MSRDKPNKLETDSGTKILTNPPENIKAATNYFQSFCKKEGVPTYVPEDWNGANTFRYSMAEDHSNLFEN